MHFKDVAEASKTASVMHFRIGQLLNNQNPICKLDLSSFLIENIGLLIIIFIGYLITFSSIFILSKVSKRKIDFYSILTVDEHRIEHKLPKSWIISFAFVCFFFLTLSLLRNLIKTDTVIVDTTEFMDSIIKLNQTTKTLISFNKVIEDAFFKLLRKTNEGNRIRLEDTKSFPDFISKIKETSNLNDLFFFMDKQWILFISNILAISGQLNDRFIFIKSNSYYEAIRVYFIRKSLEPDKKRLINLKIDRSFESGLFSHLHSKLDKLHRPSIVQQGIKIYESLELFLEELSNDSKFRIDNFRKIFLAYFFALISLVFIFIIHHIYILRTNQMIRKSDLKNFKKKLEQFN